MLGFTNIFPITSDRRNSPSAVSSRTKSVIAGDSAEWMLRTADRFGCAPEEATAKAFLRLNGSLTALATERKDGLILIDKHAAHERIRFEALKKEDHPIMAQLLLAPVSAELSREEAAAVLENKALLERCGFETEDFGGGDVLIRQIPSDVDVEDAKALLQELAGDLLAGKTLDPDSLRDNLLHTIACKSAIKAGWQTSDEELRRLVQEVLSRDDIKYCPHGRPVCVTLTKRQLEKQFKRV